MSNVIVSPNMNLQIPVTSVDPGPDFANNINASLLTLDSHNHSTGQGVPIGPAGIYINTNLPFNNNNAITLRSARFTAQTAPLSVSADYLSLNVSGVDLYYLDGNGNSVRITQGGGVSGSPGSIGSLTAPASATYVSGTPAFVFQSDSNVPANLDGGSIVLRNILANSKGTTLSAHAALAADYTVVFPAALPASQKILQLDNAGALSTSNALTGDVSITGNLALGASSQLNIGVSTLTKSSIGDVFNMSGQLQLASLPILLSTGDNYTMAIQDNTGSNARAIVVGPTGGTHGLQIVRGTVGFTSTIIAGTGWSVSRPSAGTYVVTLTDSFASIPSVTVAAYHTGIAVAVTVVSTSSFTVTTVQIPTLTSVNDDFSFIAMGERGV